MRPEERRLLFGECLTSMREAQSAWSDLLSFVQSHPPGPAECPVDAATYGELFDRLSAFGKAYARASTSLTAIVKLAESDHG